MKSRTIGVAIACIVGFIGWGICTANHMCWEGHFRHPPYPSWTYVTDIVWTSALIVAVILSSSSTIKSKITFRILCYSWLALRLVIGSVEVESIIVLCIVIAVWRAIRASEEKVQCTKGNTSS